MLAAAISILAIVAQDQAPLHAAPRDSSPRQAMLWQGDVLEVRGQKEGYLQVYDHRRERTGYLRAWMARPYAVAPESASDLLAVVRFLRDAPGSEAEGIAHAALFLRAAEGPQITAEVWDALGTMADRLARRASARFGKPTDEALAAHLDVVQTYGVKFVSVEHEDHTTLCYDGEAFRRVLALGATEEQKVDAALVLTRPECVDPALSVAARMEVDAWRAEILDRPDVAQLPPYLAMRLHVRRAGAWSILAFDRARQGEREPSAQAGKRCLDELAAVDAKELSEDDRAAYGEAAVRVGASRWAAVEGPQPPSGLGVVTRASGQPGETCVTLVDAHHPVAAPLLDKCTHGQVWTASATAAPKGHALALAVQSLESWRELWVFREEGGTWTCDVLVPSTGEPELGYVESAGWSPDGTQLLVARESREATHLTRSFDLISMETLGVEKSASSPEALTPFHRWQSPAWRSATVAVR